MQHITDLDQARAFVELLTGHAQAPCTFQTFDDNAQRRDPALARIVHGLIDAAWPELNDLAERGAGVFITIAETDLRGREAANVTRVRAVFADFDARHDQQPPEVWPLPPSIVVRSGGGSHAYWLVDDLPLDRFGEVQRRIAAAVGSDPKIVDLPRVMRLPGTLHRKADPVLVEIVDGTSDRYSLDAIEAAFPPVPDERVARAAAILARHWARGVRHDASLALAGAAARVGWAVDDAVSFVGLVNRLADATSDHEADVRDTFERHAGGEPVTGWRRLGELLGANVARDARAALGELAVRLDLPSIWTGADEMRVADEALAALVSRGGVYQRGGALVVVVHDDHGAPGIRRLSRSTLRERLSDAATFLRAAQAGPVPVGPPDPVVGALVDRGEWADVPVLSAVAGYPMLAPSGRIVVTPGYDAETRSWVEPSIAPEMPRSLAEAIAGLLDPLCDFPFASTASRSVVLAAVLSVLARPAIDGPVPLFVFDSNSPGVGKGLLSAIVGLVATGHVPPPSPQTQDEEFRKRVLGVLESGAALSCIDDCKYPIGGGTIDRLVTSWPYYEDRRLGINESARLPARTVWCATGVNVEIRDHTTRRVLLCRLDSLHERPEERADFRHRDLLSYVRSRRAELLGAALYILRAFVAAGRPCQGLRPLGSFESWSRVVRDAIVWAGLDDPCEGRESIVSASHDRSALDMLISPDGLPSMITRHGVDLPGGERGITTGAIEAALRGIRFAGVAATADGPFPAVADALRQLVRGDLDARRIGYALRSLRGRIVAGRQLVSVTGPRKVAAWVVRSAAPAAREAAE